MLRFAHGLAIFAGVVLLLGFCGFAQPHICDLACDDTPIQQHLLQYLGPGFLLALFAWGILLVMAGRTQRWGWLRWANLSAVLAILIFAATVLFLAPFIFYQPEGSFLPLLVGLVSFFLPLLVGLWWIYQLASTRSP